MIRFIRSWAEEQGFGRVELNMWEFNRDALAFYEAAGFRTYRRYMEIGTDARPGESMPPREEAEG